METQILEECSETWIHACPGESWGKNVSKILPALIKVLAKIKEYVKD